MKKLSALLLCLALLLCFASCGNGDNSATTEATQESHKNTDANSKLYGEWVTTLEMKNTGIDLPIDRTIKYYLTLSEGKYTMTVDKDDLNAAATAIVDYLSDQAEKSGSTFEELYNATEEEYKNDIISASFSEEGTWSAEKNELKSNDGAKVYSMVVNGDSEIALTQNGMTAVYTKK